MFKVVKTGKKTAKKGMSDYPFSRLFRPCECLSICSQIPTQNCIEKQPAFGDASLNRLKRLILTIFRMETHDYQAHIRRTGFHQTACQIREVHSTNGTSIQKGQRHCKSELLPQSIYTNCLASGTGCDYSATYHQREKESAKSNVYTTRQAHQSA
jgi:hypothetical protein